MKKLLSIALVLVFALSFAAPALAYTDITDGGTNPYVADIYLVDYSSTLALFGGAPSLSLPATNRAYGVNEVVAAVASFTVPANTNILDTYGSVRFSTDNVSMLVADNSFASPAVAGFINDVPRTVSGGNSTITTTAATFSLTADQADLSFDAPVGAVIAVSNKAQKYSFLVFGKVLDDDAEMSIELRRGAGFQLMNTWGLLPAARLNPTAGAIALAAPPAGIPAPANYVVLNSDYIAYTSDATARDGVARTYLVSDHPSRASQTDLLLAIEVDKNNATVGVLYMSGGVPYRFYMTAGGDIVINDAQTLANVQTNSAKYNSLLGGFTSLFDDLGLTLSNRTNIMKNSFWTDIANSANIKETVQIDPLALPYIQVPEVEVTTPPKTGSAASILGFVIIAMAGVAAVVVRKVRA